MLVIPGKDLCDKRLGTTHCASLGGGGLPTGSRQLLSAVGLLIAATLFFGNVPRCLAQGLRLPADMESALTKNAAMMDPMTLAWTRERQCLSPKDFFNYTQWKESNNRQLFLPIQIRHVRQDGKAYFLKKGRLAAESKIVNGIDASNDILEQAFDGLNYYQADGIEEARARGVEPQVNVNSLTRMSGSALDSPMFLEPAMFHLELGFRLPITFGEYRADNSVSSYLLWLIRNGAELMSVRNDAIDELPVVEVELRGTVELDRRISRTWSHIEAKDGQFRFYLDPNRGFAVRRRSEHSADGRLAVLSDCRDFSRVGDSGVWLPKHVETKYHAIFRKSPTESVLFKDVFKVQAWDSSRVDDGCFKLRYDTVSGRLVVINVMPDGKVLDQHVSFQTPSDLGEIDRVIENAIQLKTPGWSRIWPFAALSSIVLLALAVAAWKSRSRRDTATM